MIFIGRRMESQHQHMGETPKLLQRNNSKPQTLVTYNENCVIGHQHDKGRLLGVV